MKKLISTLFLSCALITPSHAQMLTAPEGQPSAPAEAHKIPENVPVPATTNEAPLEITADTALEWQRDNKIVMARGNAVAQQGDTSVAAETLTAHYTEKKEGGGMKISNVQAETNVVIKSRDTQASGDKADYDLDKGYAVMTGSDLKMTSPDQIVTAKDRFEYWVADGKFTAIGAAKIIRAKNTLQAEKISAVMKENEKGQRVLDKLEADGNVIITTPTEMVTGAHGVYLAGPNKAELTGGVKILRGPNILEGVRAEVDLNTNTSRIFGSPTEGGRVKAVFYPGTKKP